MVDLFKFLIDNYGTITAGISILFGLIFFCKKWIKHAGNTLNLGISFYDIFGKDPAKSIKETHEEIKTQHAILSIRQEIHSKLLQIGLFVGHPQTGRLVWANGYLGDLLGIDSKEMMGTGWTYAIHEDEREDLVHSYLDAVINQVVFQSRNRVINQRDNKEYLINIKVIPVYIDDTDQLLTYIACITVISE